jgi:hypothetical protein
VTGTRVLLAVLAGTAEPFAVPGGFAEAVTTGVRADRRARLRHRAFAAAGGFTVAAGVLLAVFALRPPPPTPEPRQPEVVKLPPAPPATPQAATPVRIETELAKAGDAIRETSRTITGPAASGSKVFASLANAMVPTDAPVPPDLEPAQKVLAELPEAARHGLEPVTGSARKGLARLLKDVGAVSPGGKPKS